MSSLISHHRTVVACVAGALLAACTSARPSPAVIPSVTHRMAASPARAAGTSSDAIGTPIDISSLRGRIVFSTGSPHNEDIYVMNADGTGLRRLTSDPGADFDPALSPDGTRIVFRHEGQDGSNPEVYVVGADGSEAHDVSNDPAADWGPSWSPDGRSVLWNCQRDLSYGFRACVASPDGSGLRVIPGKIYVEYPAWSPDGKKIAFMSQEPGAGGNDPDYNIYVMNADGTGIRRLTDARGSDGFPSWSPDGTRIAFSATRDDCANSNGKDCRTTGDIGPYHEVWIMNADGSNQHRLSRTFGQFASWSPDGHYLVFSPGLRVIRPDGTGETSIQPPGGLGEIEFANWSV